jgi:hypothetical protein
MGMWDLLIGRTPGTKIAQYAQESMRYLDNAGSNLKPLESAGKTVPQDAETLLGGAYGRRDTLNSFRNTETQFEDAATTAENFANGNTSNSIHWAISEAEDAQSAATRLANRPGLPSSVVDDIGDAERNADDAVETMEWTRYSNDVQRQRVAASRAAGELEDGADEIEDAGRVVQQMVAPYASFDRAFINSHEFLASAVSKTEDTAAITKNISQATREATRNAHESTVAARARLLEYAPRESTAEAQAAVANARKAVEASQQKAKTEPPPPNFTRNVWLARGGVAAGVAGAAGGTAYLIHKY